MARAPRAPVVRGCFFGEIHLPRGKTLSVDSVEYVSGGAASSVTDYQTALGGDDGARIRPPQGSSWPSVDWDAIEPVTITFTAGREGAAAVPEDIKHAIAFACSDALQIRGTVDLASGGSNFQVRETLISAWRLARLYS
jgi:hypothetical protein